TDSPANFKTRLNDENSQYVVEILGATLPEALKRPYIMKDFEGQFGAVNAYQNAGSTTARIVFELRTPGEPVVTQEGNTLLVVPAASGVTVETQMAEAPEATEEEQKDTDSDSYDLKAAAQSEKMLGARNL